MKICFLLSTLVYDGIKRSVVHFANAMQDRGHEVWLGVLHEWPGKLSLRSELRLPSERIVSWDGFRQGKREIALYQFFKKQAFDVVHTNTIKMNHLGRWAAWLARVPCIVASEDNLCLGRNWKTRLEDRILCRLGDAVVMISKAVERSFLEVEKLPQEKVRTIYYGLPIQELERHRRNSLELLQKRKEIGVSEGPLVICAARLHFSKALDILIQAAKIVIEQLPEVQFILAGDGEEKSKLETLIKDLNLQKHFHLIGAREDIYEILQLANVVTLCSLWEGLGVVLLEAMVYGKPLVGTDVSGINEIISNEENGLLVLPKSVSSLADGLLRVLKSPELVKKYSQGSRKILQERFNVQQNAKELLELYQSILKIKKT